MLLSDSSYRDCLIRVYLYLRCLKATPQLNGFMFYLCLAVVPPDLGETVFDDDGDLPPPTLVELAGAG